MPLYFQLAQQLEAAIEHGTLTPGSLLGNEIELAGRLGLSRPTVRQAIQSLVDKGLLVRRRGVGTQVVHSQVKRPLELSSLYDDLEAAGQRPATTVLVNTVVQASAEVAAALAVAEGSDVHRVERLRLAHGEPMAYLCNHLPSGLLGLDTDQLQATGLYRLMRAAGINPAQRPPVHRRPGRHPRRGRAARRGGGRSAADDAAHDLRRHRPGGGVRRPHLPADPLLLRVPAARTSLRASARPARRGRIVRTR
ncbi:DNA-binding GntR family transcriptional regulator [Streptomyces rishiriensis]|uniref:DNA-binding GntR family transcriptional regulator n=1 Tax=Streptomyces rishiriensis TaxID=68264 RepID=A0ABU0NYQ5_STRRH|nr:DNA-binding GntR family transcriptional regulator [Streptomyces rishiriensis]